MTSLRHNGSAGTEPVERDGARAAAEDDLLDAARAAILAVGWKRSTLTDVARRAGVSRMTIYRRWPDMATLTADLMTREWGGLAPTAGADSAASSADQIAAGVASTVSALREDELFAKILHVDPELLLPYLLDRRGRTQDSLLDALVGAIESGQHAGTVRAGRPVLLARGVLLASYGFALSASTMSGQGVDMAALDAELRRIVAGYLAP